MAKSDLFNITVTSCAPPPDIPGEEMITDAPPAQRLWENDWKLLRGVETNAALSRIPRHAVRHPAYPIQILMSGIKYGGD